MLGNTSFPGKLNFGTSLAAFPKCSFLATKPTGLSAGLVATYRIVRYWFYFGEYWLKLLTFTITFALKK